MVPRKLTGNDMVDAMGSLAITGNVIPAIWYKTITSPSGKADMAAINILSDIVYWYRPREIRDEFTGDVVAYQKRFSADLLQRSYDQLAEHFGISKRQAKEAVVRLEEIGAVKRVFRNVECSTGLMGNVMFIAISPERICELTYPEAFEPQDPMTEKRHRYDGDDPELGTPMTEIRHRYGEKTPDIYIDYSETTKRLSSDQPTNLKENLSCDKGDGWLEGSSEEFEKAWEKVPESKASQCAKEKAWRIWQATLKDNCVDEPFLAASYRKYVVQQEHAGTEPRYIATLSTWLKPNRPLAGHSLQTALEKREESKRRSELVRVAKKAEEEKEREEARLAELEAAWRDSDPEAKRLHDLAWDFSAGFDAVGNAMAEYCAYREARFKPD